MRAEVRGHLTRPARGHGGPEQVAWDRASAPEARDERCPRASARITPAHRMKDPTPTSRALSGALRADDAGVGRWCSDVAVAETREAIAHLVGRTAVLEFGRQMIVQLEHDFAT